MIKSKKILYILYFLGFIFSIHASLPAFINSSFLNTYLAENMVGAVYTLGAFFSLITLIYAPRILSKLGNYKTMLLLTIVESGALLTLAFSNSLIFIIAAFVSYLVVIAFVALNIDLFLEFFSSDAETGKIRGKMLTSINLAWVISPAIAGFLLTNGDYWKIYLISSTAIFLVFLITLLNFRKFKDPVHEDIDFWETLKEIKANKNLYNIFMSRLILSFFYAWMIIYSPIYLHQYIGFSWNEIGIILTIMLLPFIIFEFPLGKLADKFFGEKEILSIGFLIMALSTMSLSFITSTDVIIWAIALFITRIGASAIEIMTESYFFKQIDASDTNVISFYRNIRNISYIVGPLVASLFLSFFEYKYLFLFLGIIVLWGLKYSLTLKDTK